jgi:hypothetical protein
VVRRATEGGMMTPKEAMRVLNEATYEELREAVAMLSQAQRDRLRALLNQQRYVKVA